MVEAALLEVLAMMHQMGLGEWCEFFSCELLVRM
jgi:hypothetical protein